MLYRFYDRVRYWSKVAVFFIPTCIHASLRGDPRRNFAVRKNYNGGATRGRKKV